MAYRLVLLHCSFSFVYNSILTQNILVTFVLMILISQKSNHEVSKSLTEEALFAYVDKILAFMTTYPPPLTFSTL